MSSSVVFTAGGATRMSIDASSGAATFNVPPECSTAPTTGNQLANKSYVDSAGGGGASLSGTDDYFTYKSGTSALDTSGYLFIKGTGVACTNTLTSGVTTAGIGTGKLELFNTQSTNDAPYIYTYKNKNGGATTSGTALYLHRIYGTSPGGITQAATIGCTQTRAITAGFQAPSNLQFAVQNDTVGLTQVTVNPATSIESNTGSLTINNTANYWMGFGSIAGLTQTGIIRSTTAQLGFVVNTATVMRLTDAGRLGLGITNPATYQLQLSTDSAGKPTTNTWTISSDQRIKKGIEDADLAICYDNIKSLRLRRFEWDPEYYDGSITQDRHALGFIAQEVKERFPRAITIEPLKEFEIKTRDNEGYIKTETKTLENFHSLNTDQIDKSHLGATQMLIKKVEELEAKLAALEKSKCTCMECEMKEIVQDS